MIRGKLPALPDDVLEGLVNDATSNAYDLESSVEELANAIRTASSVETLTDFFANLDEAEGTLVSLLGDVRTLRRETKEAIRDARKTVAEEKEDA